MKRSTWKKHHKWIGIFFCPFILLFCISGITLNHRDLVSHIDISRTYLPTSFQYKNWNNSLVKGTISYHTEKDSLILLYGNAGIWATNSAVDSISTFNEGFPKGVDHRNIVAMAKSPQGEYFAAAQFGLYQLDIQSQSWINVLQSEKERLTDLIFKGDSLVLLSRSSIHLATPPYTDFKELTLQTPKDYKNEVTLFRTIWLIHSGELFGLTGKIIVDALGILLILISITGIIYWLTPKYIKRRVRTGRRVSQSKTLLKGSLSWHDKLGRYTIGITLFLAITGWSLRPPLLIALVQSKVPPMPYTKLDSKNAWNDKLRAIRFDQKQQDWLIYSSDGFFCLNSLEDTPQKLDKTAPVSVMGINAFQQVNNNTWVIGSFSGLYTWNRTTGEARDWYTQEVSQEISGPPFGRKAITGISYDFKNRLSIFEYNEGSDFATMPKELEHQPISLWNLALEVHTGRIYTFLGDVALIYIFFAGILVIWVLISGYKLRRKKRSKQSIKMT